MEADRSAFRFLGRVASARLKGCSWNVERPDISLEQLTVHQAIPHISQKKPEMLRISQSGLRDRAQRAQMVLEELLGDNTFCELFAHEVGTKNLGKSAIQDIRDGMPRSLDAWQAAALSSIGGQGKTEVMKNWLVILPRSHPQALFHPLFLGYVLGLSLFVRRTTANTHTVESYVLDKLSRQDGCNMVRMPPEYTVGVSPPPFQDGALLAFGADETILHFKECSRLPTNGFGTVITGSMVCMSEIGAVSPKLAKDFFSLGQKGCFSSRYLVIIKDIDCAIEDIVSILAKAGRVFIGEDFSAMTNAAIDHEMLRLGMLGARLPNWDKLNEPLFALWREPWEETGTMAEKLANVSPSVAIFLVSPAKSIPWLLADITKREANFRRISLSPLVMGQIKGSEFSHNENFCSLGAANAPLWNGRHEGRPIFAL